MLIFILLLATLIVVVCFVCLLYFITNVLNTYYVITNIGSICYYQIVDANTLEENIDNVNNVLDIDERNYLDINVITFTLFLLYIFCVKEKANKNFFDSYFCKHYKTIVY